MNSRFSLYFIVLSVIQLSGPLAKAEVTLTTPNKIVLKEFTINAKSTLLQKLVSCSEQEVKSGVRNLIAFGGKDNSLRALKPTYRPLDNEASWYIEQSDCPSLAPYVNGIGFDSFEPKTGAAKIYLAGFNPKRIDEEKWQDGKGLSRMQMVFQPEFNVINVVKFDAVCEISRRTALSALRITGGSLVCKLEGGNGQIIFEIKKDSN